MKPDYPPTPVRPVIDSMHGVEITDDYRWLEDGDSPEVATWTAAQNAFGRRFLDGLPGRAEIGAQLERMADVTVTGVPQVKGERLFFFRREAGQNHAVLLWREKDTAGPERVALDPNTFSEDGTVAMDWHHVSPDGRLIAYGTSPGGSEQSTLRVRDLERGQDLDLEIARTRGSGAAWLPDASGFYYTRYPEPGSVPEGEETYHRRLFFHALGTDPGTDPLVFEPARKEMWTYGYASSDGLTLFIHVSDGWTRNDLYAMPLVPFSPGMEPRPIAVGLEALFTGDAAGDTLWVQTNLEAPRGRLMRGSLAAPDPSAWQEIVPQGEGVLGFFDLRRDRLVLGRTLAAVSSLAVHRLDGTLEREVVLPTLGTVAGTGGRWDSSDLYYGFQSFAYPPTVLHLDLESGRSSVFAQADLDFDLSGYEAKQVFYTSRDGTRVPMFVVHRAGLKLDGHNPALLYGYGGFTVSMTPAFSGGLFVWLDRGGVYAVANLRGGDEYGEDWHRAGMVLGNKQNVFDDFIAAGEYLVSEGYTRPGKLAIYGGSNGGLLTGAALTQRPDLWGAVVIGVPLLDMLRYHQFQIARLWIPEYGDPEDPEHFGWLRAYSPYHRVTPGTAYPPTLIMTGESDTRVDPLHARKMAALLQRESGGEAPILLRVEGKAGHGQGKPISKVIEADTDRWAFTFAALQAWPRVEELAGG